jgi:hypothetical protein
MLLAMVAAVAVACDPVSPEAKLVLSETTLSLEAVSGEATFTITSDQAWEAVADATWLTLSPASGDASEDAMTVIVTAEDNGTEDARDAVITVKAGTFVKTINVAQAAKAVSAVTTFEANWCEGLYSGDAFSYEAGTYNYLVILSDNGLADPDDYTSYNPNTTYYQLDLYSEIPAEEGEYAVIPNGTYQLDLEDTYAANTISAQSSKLIVTGADAVNEDPQTVRFAEATVVVTDGKIVLTATLANGDRHEVTFEGALEIPVYGYGEEEGDDWISEDLVIDASEAEFDIYQDEEIPGLWWVDVIDPDYNMVSLILYLPENAEGVEGVYNAQTEEGQTGVFIPGNMEEYFGSFYYSYPSAAFVTGTITITEEGEVYTITFNCTDGADHAITGSISGTLIVYEEE